MYVQVVFHNAVGSTVGNPQELIGCDHVRVRRRSNAGLPHIEEFAVFVEHLNPPMSAVHNEQAAVVADLNAVNVLNSFGPGFFGSLGGWPQSIKNFPSLSNFATRVPP